MINRDRLSRHLSHSSTTTSASVNIGEITSSNSDPSLLLSLLAVVVCALPVVLARIHRQGERCCEDLLHSYQGNQILIFEFVDEVQTRKRRRIMRILNSRLGLILCLLLLVQLAASQSFQAGGRQDDTAASDTSIATATPTSDSGGSDDASATPDSTSDDSKTAQSTPSDTDSVTTTASRTRTRHPKPTSTKVTHTDILHNSTLLNGMK